MCVMTRFTLLIAFMMALLMPASPASAQFPPPTPVEVTAYLDHTALQPGQQAVLALVLDVPDGFTVPAHDAPEGFFGLAVRDVTAVTQAAAGDADVASVITAYAPTYPAGTLKTYPGLDEMPVNAGRVIVYVPIEVSPDAPAGGLSIRGVVRTQQCEEESGVCYSPQEQSFDVTVPVVPAGTAIDTQHADIFADFDPSVWANLVAAGAGETLAAQRAAGTTYEIFGLTLSLSQNAWALALLVAFAVGVTFNVVPCVLPVLPLKVMGMIQAAQENRLKSVVFALFFGLGMVAVFASLSVLIVGLKAFDWGEPFGNPVFAGVIVTLLVVAAASMFGLFGVNLPTSVYRFSPRHDTYGGNVAWGAFTAVLSTPCTFGLFVFLLTWATANPSTLIGVVSVAFVGVGMAAPYVVLAAFPGIVRKFPRTGPWAELVKQTMGFFLLAVAAYFAQGLLPDALRGPGFWYVIFGFVAAGGVFMVVRATMFGQTWLAPAVAAGIALLFVGPTFAFAHKLANPPVQWVYFEQNELQKALSAGNLVVVKFTADWCANCHTVEATVFTEATATYLRERDVVPIKVDLSNYSDAEKALLAELDVRGIPFTAVYLPGREAPVRLSGIYGTQDLKAALGE